jgi:DNA-binding NarL/FixJ family response regulator/putative methionine-R-sulfoxide reductase with GAF domain
VINLSGDALTTVFAYDIDPQTDWRSLFEPDIVVRALSGTTTGTAIAAGKWDEQAAFGLITRIDLPDGEALLCALRHGIPFDTVELGTATAAAELLAMSVEDGRAITEARNETERHIDRAAVLERLFAGLGETQDASALLANAAEEIAMQIGAGGASIMLVEGDQLRLRASFGLDIPLGHGQGIAEGIAGWVASRGEKVVLRGPVDDQRFRGSDPEAGEAVVVPLRSGTDVIGVLNVKRPRDGGFDEKIDDLEAVAADIARALSAVSKIGALEGERRSATAIEEILRHAAAHEPEAAARAAARAFGHHAVAVRAADGRLLALYSEDKECRDAALEASARAEPVEGTAVRVGVARHGAAYATADTESGERAANALALLGKADGVPARAAAIRVLAVEDHPVMRLGVRALLEREGIAIAGLTATCAEALDLIRETEPDAVLLDLGLPDAVGAEAVERIREASPSVPIVVFSVERTPEIIRSALRAGANGYVSKDAPTTQVVAALQAAAEGLTALGSAEVQALTRAIEPRPVLEPVEEVVESAESEPDEGEPGAPVPVREPLTPRELELLRYLAEGYTNKEIARAMVLAEDTVKKGVQTLIAKLGATDRTHAVVLALRRHLIE